MPKMKSSRGARKRVRIRAGGKMKRAKANRRHILTSKKRKRKRGLRQAGQIHAADVRSIRKLLPYG